jgi:hypothetical protein
MTLNWILLEKTFFWFVFICNLYIFYLLIKSFLKNIFSYNLYANIALLCFCNAILFAMFKNDEFNFINGFFLCFGVFALFWGLAVSSKYSKLVVDNIIRKGSRKAYNEAISALRLNKKQKVIAVITWMVSFAGIVWTIID